MDQATLWHKLGTTPLSELHMDLAEALGDIESDTYLDKLLHNAEKVSSTLGGSGG